MKLTVGTRIGGFEILDSLGAGGMGEVYRARDTKLGRDVALKILPASFASDPDRLMRFEREAKTLAALNHPHIAHIHGLEESSGVRALVMELVEGEDLAQRLARGPIPLDEALPIARHIAEALEAAHEQGIIHRDLKPANIKVRADGTVKVLDFGLAKALDTPDGGQRADALVNSPTITSPGMTQAGLILGTAAYMAPEQAKGKPVGKQADIWAFGCVLYEMLTGRRAFAGDDITDTLTAVLRDAPEWSALPAGTPAGVRRLLERCLERDTRRRLRDIGDAIADLTDRPSEDVVAPARSRGGMGMAAAALAIAVALGSALDRLWLWNGGSPATSETAVVAYIAAPPEVISAFHDGFALSPDARSLAFTARNASGLRQIWLRRLDSSQAAPIAGTERARYPFWSPDGRHLGFFADEVLRRVPVEGGTAQAVSAAQGLYPTGSWSEAGEILFAVLQGARFNIYKVPASGGAPQRLDLEPEAHRPQWVAGSGAFLYGGESKEEAGVFLHSAGTSKLVAPLDRGIDLDAFAYSPAGYLLVNRKGALTALQFDDRRGSAAGDGLVLSGRAGTPKSWLAVSAAKTSVVAMVPRSPTDSGDAGDPVARLRWVNRAGEFVGELGEPARYWTIRLSPDARRTTTNFGDSLWLLEGGSRRLPVSGAGAGDFAYHAVWSPDGRDMAFTSGSGQILRRPVDREGAATPLKGVHGVPTDWSRDGTSLLVTTDKSDESRSADIVMYDLASNTARPWLATAAAEVSARFSPDGRWIAYSSNATGRSEVFVASRASGSALQPVSSRGGAFPIWRGDGRELFYLTPNDEVMAVSVTSGPGALSIGEPTRLFRIALNDITGDVFSPYDVTPDGQRFLLNVPEPPLPLLYVNGIDRLFNQRSGSSGSR